VLLSALAVSLLWLFQANFATAASPQSCAALTPAAIDDIITTLHTSLAHAEADATANGTTGAYAVAAVYNRDGVKAAHEQFVTLQTWLNEQGLAAPYVSNTSAAYSVHGTVREAVSQLHHARHWATISVVYHGSADAHASMEVTSTALERIDTLGANAARCYIEAYYP
jgi:hypothetical protein